MRILITGGAGCLGSNLVEHWLPKGHEIAVIDNFATGKRDVVPDVAGLTVVEGDIADSETVRKLFQDFTPDVVIHAAASYKNPDEWHEDIATNVLGAANVAKAAEWQKVKRVVNFQTSLCYGRPAHTPVPPSHPMSPFTCYGITKTAGEQLLLLSSVKVTSLRLANITGPRLAIGPIPTFYKRLKAGQNCFCTESSRDFMDMSDFLEFMDVAIEPGAPCGLYNLGTGEAHSVKEIYDIVREHLGLPPENVRVEPVGPDDVAVMALDASESERVFGWKPKVSFREAIKRQLFWYNQHGVTDVFSHLSITPKKSG